MTFRRRSDATPFIPIIAALLVCATAAAQDGGAGAAPAPLPPLTPLPLEEALDKAMAQNPQILSGQLSIDAAIAARKSARAYFLPILSAEATFLYYSEKPGFGDFDPIDMGDPTMCTLMDELDEQGFCQGLFDAFGSMADMSSSLQSEQYDFKITITVAQPLTPLYQAYYGYKLADLGVDVATIEKEKAAADLKMQTIEAYYGYLKARAALRSMDEAIASVEGHVKQADAFFGADLITKNDLLQAQTRLALLKGSRLKVEQAVILAREGLLILMNEPAGTPLEPADQPEAEKAYVLGSGVPDEEQALKLARKNRPELKQMASIVEQADTARKLAKGGYIPSLSAFGSYQHEEGSVMDLPDFMVGATLSWNFFQWGKVYYSVEEAKARKAAAEAGYEALVRGVQLEVKQALLGIDLALKEIEVQKEAVAAAEEQLRIEKQRYDKQVSTTTEVLDATTRLVQAQVDLSTYQYDHLVALARVRRACGTL